MRLVATEYLTLDGVFEEPGRWSGPWFDDEAGQFKWSELTASDALLMGRLTYEGFAAAWPKMEGTGDFGVKMNTMTKYVVSSKLDRPEWPGTEVIKDNAAEEIRTLRERPGGDLLLSGSAQLFNALMQEGLIDLYRFMVHPVVLGKGKRLFADGVKRAPLELTESRRLPKGIVILEYVPAANT